MMEHIIIPYVQKERKLLNLPVDHPVLLIMDVLKGQMTDAVKETLKKNHVILQKVPANLTYSFQPLDVQGGPNGYAKRFMKDKFTVWYSDKVQRQMDTGKVLELIDIDFKLSILKPLHAKWLLELFNRMTSEEGKNVNMKGWEVAGISGVVNKAIACLPSLDPFDDIDPLSSSPMVIENETSPLDKDHRNMYINESGDADDKDDEDWVDSDGNCFDLFNDPETGEEDSQLIKLMTSYLNKYIHYFESLKLLLCYFHWLTVFNESQKHEICKKTVYSEISK